MSKSKKVHLRTLMADGRAGSSSACGHRRPGHGMKLVPLAEFLAAPLDHRCKDCQKSAEKKADEQQLAKFLTSEAIARHILLQVNPNFSRA